jgi:dienelactone hydrolase
MTDSLIATDATRDFERREITLIGETKTVYVAGSGPAVIVMSEMPGIYNLVIEFARKVRDAGFTVWMPHMFGEVGRPPSGGYLLGTMARACISREFYAFSSNRTSPIVDWLRALAAHAFPLCGGKGVGAIGMCFTGNFALSMMLEPSVIAPVMCQPSLPILSKGGMHISPRDLKCVKDRLDDEDLTVLAYRFAGDSFCRSERFADYEEALGDRFQATVLPDEAAAVSDNPPHSVVTMHLIDKEGEPTRAAVDEILGFYTDRLLPDEQDNG